MVHIILSLHTLPTSHIINTDTGAHSPNTHIKDTAQEANTVMDIITSRHIIRVLTPGDIEVEIRHTITPTHGGNKILYTTMVYKKPKR